MFNRSAAAVEQVEGPAGNAGECVNLTGPSAQRDRRCTRLPSHPQEVKQMKTLRQWNALRSQRKGGVRPAGSHFKWAA